MTSLAGTWWNPQDNVTLFIQGRDPAYTFQGVMAGTTLSQGTINRISQGNWLATGQGIGGAVNLRLWFADQDTLQSRNEVLVDGGVIDGLMRSILPQYGALVPQPVVTWFRQRTEMPVTGKDELEMEETTTAPKKIPHTKDTRHKRVEAEKKGEAARLQKAERQHAEDAQSSEDPMKELEKLIGMKEVKDELESLDAWAWRQRQLKEQGLEAEVPSMHMSFAGGPGTGKTTISRIIGRLLKKYGLLDHGRVSEVGRADLVGEFVGQTAPKTEKAIEESIGGVLFIDEAYALSEPSAGVGARDYGAEALAALIAGMENHRDKLCVIVAGYPDEMKRFIDANAGLASRISRHITFPDYTEEELERIFEKMAEKQKLVLDPKILESFQANAHRAKLASNPRQWGNARWVRNILERGVERQSVRLRKLNKRPTREELLKLEVSDFEFLST